MDKSVLDDQQSMNGCSFIKKSSVLYLEDIRHTDPQATIDHIFDRKEKWKKAARRFYMDLQKLKSEHQQQVQIWKRKFQKESEMKQWWKIATIAVAGSAMAMIFIIFLVMFSVTMVRRNDEERPMLVPTSGILQQTPNHVLSSVILYNGEVQGSGTIISKGEKYALMLSAGHNFSGSVGGDFWVYYVDGTYTKGTLLSIDKEKDLAICKVPVDTIISHSYIPSVYPKGAAITSVGFTNGKGPIFKKLKYKDQFKDVTRNCYVWKFSLQSGEYWDGDSGGGIFLDNALSAIATHRNYGQKQCVNGKWIDQDVYATPYNEILAFLNSNKDKLVDCGDWSVPPIMAVANSDGPPLWQPTPNVPIHIPDKNVEPIPTNVTEKLKPSDVGIPEKILSPTYKD